MENFFQSIIESGVWLILLMFLVFYLLLIRPQHKKQKERQQMLNNLQKGNRVITIGGIHGVIKEIDDNNVSLRVADNLNLKFARAAVDRVIDDQE